MLRRSQSRYVCIREREALVGSVRPCEQKLSIGSHGRAETTENHAILLMIKLAVAHLREAGLNQPNVRFCLGNVDFPFDIFQRYYKIACIVTVFANFSLGALPRTSQPEPTAATLARANIPCHETHRRMRRRPTTTTAPPIAPTARAMSCSSSDQLMVLLPRMPPKVFQRCIALAACGADARLAVTARGSSS